MLRHEKHHEKKKAIRREIQGVPGEFPEECRVRARPEGVCPARARWTEGTAGVQAPGRTCLVELQGAQVAEWNERGGE